jgi:predicted RNA-binding protein
MDYLRDILDDDSTNFRKKLKRMDLEKFDSAAQNALA